MIEVQRRWRQRRACLLGVIGLALTLIAGGCALVAEDRASRVVYSSVGDWVKIVPRESIGPGNDHPVTLSPQRITQILASIQVTSALPGGRPALLQSRTELELRTDAQPRRLFTPRDLEILAEPLSQALASAGPEEDVLLRVQHARPGRLTKVALSSRITTARIFHYDDRLHLIAGVIDASPQPPSSGLVNAKVPDYSDARSEILHPLPGGSRHGSAEPSGVLMSELASNEAPAGRDDWLALRLSGPLPAAGSTTTPATGQEPPFPFADDEASDIDPLLEHDLLRLRQLYERGMLTGRFTRRWFVRHLRNTVHGSSWWHAPHSGLGFDTPSPTGPPPSSFAPSPA